MLNTRNTENNAMFNETVNIYKRYRNTLRFKVTDRDRRSVDLTGTDLKLTIIDDHTELPVASYYLSVTNTNNIIEVVLDPSDIEDLEESEYYSYVASIVHDRGTVDEVEEPLYTDHNFEITGRMHVKEPKKKVTETVVSETRKRIENFMNRLMNQFQIHDHDDVDFIDGQYYFDYLITTDDQYISSFFYSNDNSVISELIIQKHNRKDFPLNLRDNTQWKDDMKLFNVGDTEIKLNLKTWEHYRIVMVTHHPEPYRLRIKHI